MKLFIPKDYESKLSLKSTESAIDLIKTTFARNLKNALSLSRVSAPLFLESGTGLNDNLNGYERPVVFDIAQTKTSAEIVHSLAKWKRYALKKYGFREFTGIYTDMNAIRRDEELDNLHSIYVDQWDYEFVITKDTRNIDFLKETVRKIVKAICDTLETVKQSYPMIKTKIEKEITFITSQELEDKYPDLSPKERESEFLKTHHTTFIMQIGDKLQSGKEHDGRSPDYDDWSLNGDLIFYNAVLDCAFEVSSMGIRVDEKALRSQLEKADKTDRMQLPFHKMLLNGELPLTLGGGIGQSRLCMLFLEKAHIGEVQVSVWDKETISECEKAGIKLL